MLGIFKKKTKILAPMSGEVKPLTAVGDAVFAKELVGKGVAIEPSDGEIYAPISGQLIQIVSSKHAYAIVSDEGIEVLIHCGIDTVELAGEGFTTYKSIGDSITVGDHLATMDLEFIRSKGKSCITPVVITNHENYTNLSMKYGQAVRALTTIIKIEK